MLVLSRLDVAKFVPVVLDSPMLDAEDEPEEDPDGLVFSGLSEEMDGEETSPPLTDEALSVSEGCRDITPVPVIMKTALISTIRRMI